MLLLSAEIEGVWLTPEDVAQRFSISRATVYRALNEGRLPGMKILGCWRVDPDELAEWIASKRRVPRPRTIREEFIAEVAAIRRGSNAAGS